MFQTPILGLELCVFSKGWCIYWSIPPCCTGHLCCVEFSFVAFFVPIQRGLEVFYMPNSLQLHDHQQRLWCDKKEVHKKGILTAQMELSLLLLICVDLCPIGESDYKPDNGGMWKWGSGLHVCIITLLKLYHQWCGTNIWKEEICFLPDSTSVLLNSDYSHWHYWWLYLLVVQISKCKRCGMNWLGTSYKEFTRTNMLQYV